MTTIHQSPRAEQVCARDIFGIDSDLLVPCAEDVGALREHVPEADPGYVFDPEATLAICLGFAHRRRVYLHGPHGTGKSTHVEQVAARLGWPCLRVNLDGHLSRMDLLGRDVITVEDGHPVTAFHEGVLPWAVQRPVALLLDEYDSGRPEVMFVLQRLLEQDGRLTLMDQARVITPHPGFRVFATGNTVGLGDDTGTYRGVQRLNHAQLDRWNLVVGLDYLPPEREIDMVLGQVPQLGNRTVVSSMVELATLTRASHRAGDLSCVLSPRGVVTWAENTALLGDVRTAFRLGFAGRCAPDEVELLAELWQRCMDDELTPNTSA